MLYGTINRCNLGFQIHVEGYDRMTYMQFTLREAKQRYRRQFKLKGKKIVWSGNLSCFT